ncbi:SIR2 family NAD-dependent protein deacylase [Lysinibacillus agricola]|uniref:SIR2 family NAD-dependent protein deacylase n=1 Tax=Lysinibacillus agricola TaxID=2590012 RepID=UPI003C27EDEC
MLLDQLVNDLQIEDTILIKFLDKIGNNSTFNEDLFVEFEPQIKDSILKKLIEIDYISLQYRYECELNDEIVFLIKDVDSKCEYCGDLLTNNHHLVRNIYTNKTRTLLNEITEYKQQKILKIVDEKYLHNLRLLKQDLKLGTLIPFVGAGTSIALGLPNWQGLIKICSDGLVGRDKREFENLLDNNGDIFKAIEILLSQSNTYDISKVKERISSYIRQNFNTRADEISHNVLDLLKLNSKFYLTTNYDDALSIYQTKHNYPLLPSEVNNVQHFLRANENRVIHLHGIYHRPDTLIVSKGDYDAIYSNEKLKSLLTSIMSNQLLFVGFSFKDQYFKDMFQSIKHYIGGSHYIILFDIYDYDAQELKDEGLLPISLKLDNEYGFDRVRLIKELLNYLLH